MRVIVRTMRAMRVIVRAMRAMRVKQKIKKTKNKRIKKRNK